MVSVVLFGFVVDWVLWKMNTARKRSGRRRENQHCQASQATTAIPAALSGLPYRGAGPTVLGPASTRQADILLAPMRWRGLAGWREPANPRCDRTCARERFPWRVTHCPITVAAVALLQACF